MPLSTPAERELAHTRTIQCRGYARADGLWDIEAQMVDTKPFSFSNTDRGGMIHADEPLHDMKVRLTLDDQLCILAAEAVTDHAPFNVCVEINAAYQQLVGLSIAPGWNQRLKTSFAGVKGCTHITELLGVMATAAYQSVFGSEQRRRQSDEDRAAGRAGKPSHLNTCHAFASGGPVVKRHWPEAYTGE